MLTVCLHIPQVVEAIDGTGNQTKRRKYNQRRPKEFRLQQIIAEEDRRKNEEVFEPLQRPYQFYVMYHSEAKVRISEHMTKQIVLFLSWVTYNR